MLFPYAMSYMRYINIFLPVAVFSNYIAIFIRADNDPNRAMAGVLLGRIVNIVLDIIFVFPMHLAVAKYHLKQFRLYYGSRSLKTRMQLRPCHRKSMQVHGNRPQVIS